MAEAKTNARKAWEQQQGESDDAYTRFLAYRNLGPARSVLLAYASLKPPTPKSKDKPTLWAPRIWWEDCRNFQWKDRAAAWDVSQMAKSVPEAAATIFKLMGETARACLAEVANGNIKPQSFEELKNMVVILGNFISPEVIRTTIDNPGNAGDSELGSRGR